MLAQMTVEENLLVAAADPRRGRRAGRLDGLYDRFPILRERRAAFRPGRSPAANSRCSRSRARSIGRPEACCCSTNRRWGWRPNSSTRSSAIIADERARGTSILLVEQNARRALAIADHAYVMERGRITLEGTGADLLADENVTAAYLGG